MKKLLVMCFMLVLLAACGGQEASLLSKAKYLADKGEYEKAIHVYSQIIKKYPSHFVAYANRGLLYERVKAKDAEQAKKNKALAQSDYENALALNYSSPEILNNLAALYIDQGNYEEAISSLDEALFLRPDYQIALLNRAIAHSKKGRLDLALKDFADLQNLNDKMPLLYLNRGLTQYVAGYYQAALNDYAALIELDPQNARAYLERGRVFIKMGLFQNALADFQQAMLIQPDYAMPYFYAAELLFSRGDTEEGISYAEQAKALAPTYAPVYDMLGDMLALTSPVEATQHYLAARRLDPKRAARYEKKIKMMTTENGRKRVTASRFMNLEKK